MTKNIIEEINAEVREQAATDSGVKLRSLITKQLGSDLMKNRTSLLLTAINLRDLIVAALSTIEHANVKDEDKEAAEKDIVLYKTAIQEITDKINTVLTEDQKETAVVEKEITEVEEVLKKYNGQDFGNYFKRNFMVVPVNLWRN